MACMASIATIPASWARRYIQCLQSLKTNMQTCSKSSNRQAATLDRHKQIQDSVTEWLRWWTRNPLGSARRGSNPLAVVVPVILCFYMSGLLRELNPGRLASWAIIMPLEPANKCDPSDLPNSDTHTHTHLCNHITRHKKWTPVTTSLFQHQMCSAPCSQT